MQATNNRRVTIRRILLLAFLLVSLIPASVLTLLAFERTQAAMRQEIELAVQQISASVASDASKFLYERMLNATTWNHLEVMQDLRLKDVDKRLSRFLSEMKHRYGAVYRDIHAVDSQGKVIASSDPASIGAQRKLDQPWKEVAFPDGQIRLEKPIHGRGGRRLSLHSQIDSPFADGPIGELILDVNFERLEAILDDAANNSRQVLILDAAHGVFSASQRLREHGYDFASQLPALQGDWSAALRSALPARRGELIVGRQTIDEGGPLGELGWNAALVQSEDVAMAPVRRMAWVFAGLLAATALFTALISMMISRRIASPIVALTEFTRRYLRPGASLSPPPQAWGEVGELNRSFIKLVDDLQASQQTLIQASKLAALGEVTALMAHEVRTPLGILRSSVQMLRSESQLSADGAELLNIIESETGRLNRLVSSMLDSSRTRAPERMPTDIHALILHALSLLASQVRDRQIQITTRLDATSFVADCDKEQMTQVLLNLLMNALQILPKGGRIEVLTRNAQDRLMIEISDDGPGIPEEDRSRIFEPFIYKREGGIGLGLAVVRQIVRGHGGDIVAELSAFGGARFRVSLPLIDPDKL